MVVNRDRVVLADTNIISYVFKRQPLGTRYNHLLIGREVRLSFVTVAELNSWAEDNNWGARRRLELRIFLSRFPMVPCTAGIPELFAKIMADRQRAGRPMLPDDGWIAATAMYHDLPLVTHDANFLGTEGLRVISANPEIIALQALPSARGPLEMDMQCRCGY
jgi:predicted nucleic acid-binding protein